jgi:superfamily II DNA/RNA helicase
VQAAAIPEILAGGNVAVQCYTGSGKTLAYLLPVLSLAVQRAEAEWAAVTRRTVSQAGAVQAVVVAPSRELAMQIMRVAQSLLPETAKRAVQQCIGGASMERQREALRLYRPVLVVGTPGRLAELSRDGALMTHRAGMLVLDEADQLLAPQFREEMLRVVEHAGKRAEGGRQTVIVSATLTPSVLALCEPWCPAARAVYVGPRAPASADEEGAPAAAPSAGASWGWGAPGATEAPSGPGPTSGSAGGFGNADAAPAVAPNLRHLYVSCAPQHRVDAVRRAIHALDAQRALVFMNFGHRLRDAQGKLEAKRMAVGSLHGDMSKVERQNTLAAFKAGRYRALLVSDVAARGLDIPECDAVFNLELPSDAAHYAHRAGRTGRAGRAGTVVSVVTGGERFVVEKLGRRLGVAIAEVELAGGEVSERPEGSPPLPRDPPRKARAAAAEAAPAAAADPPELRLL